MPMDENAEDPIHRLLAGVRKFNREVFPARRAIYEQVARDGQQPHTLFITCADSRIDPEKLTQIGPGEMFVSRNIGNIVPAFGEMLGGVSAVIEFAVSAQSVSEIVICGHTDCGAMKALLDPAKVSGMPIVKAWLRNAEAALSLAETDRAGSPEEMLERLIEQNVRLQLEHLRTHPSVAERISRGAVGLHGWVYDIASGNVCVLDHATSRFVPVPTE